MSRLRNFPWNFHALLLFVLLGQHAYVLCKFSYSFKLDEHGLYTPGETYNTSCYVEASGNDSVSDVDVYLSFGNSNYCHNGQIGSANRSQSCSEASNANRITYSLSLPDLRVTDSGMYSCKINNRTTGAHKLSIHQNISVVDPASITTHQQLTTQDNGTGGSMSIHSQTFSPVLFILAFLAFYLYKDK